MSSERSLTAVFCPNRLSRFFIERAGAPRVVGVPGVKGAVVITCHRRALRKKGARSFPSAALSVGARPYPPEAVGSGYERCQLRRRSSPCPRVGRSGGRPDDVPVPLRRPQGRDETRHVAGLRRRSRGGGAHSRPTLPAPLPRRGARGGIR